MGSPFDAAGANHEGSDYAPLTTDEFFTGLDTNRNPLRDAMVPYLQRKFYQAGRYDSIWDGLNMEVSAKMTLIRRPGHTAYNTSTFLPVGRWYGFRTQVDGKTRIRVIVDTAAAVYDGTGPNTKTLIYLKQAGAGKTYFQSVGNTLYMGDGVEQLKWTLPTKSWMANTEYSAGDSVLDANGDIQVAFAYTSAVVNFSSISAGPHPIGFPPVFNRFNLGLVGGVSPFADGEELTVQGLDNASQFNGRTFPVINLGAGNIRFLVSGATFFAGGTDTGVVYGGGINSNATGVSGNTLPAFSAIPGTPTTDGTVIWINKGSALEKWGTDSPTVAPSVAQAPVQSPYPAWTASTYYSPNLITYNAADLTTFAILTQAGVTGAAEPTFNPTIGGNTNDGSAQWGTINAAWNASSLFAATSIVVVSISGTLYAFNCVLAGLSGATAPAWPPTFNAQISDGTAIWQNIGPVAEWNSIGATTAVSLAQAILDPGGFIQDVEIAGISGAVIPTFNETLTGLTTDNAATWVNAGPYATAGSAASQVAYSFSSSVNFVESNLSPATTFTFRAGHSPIYQGPGSDDPQIDTINIYRTAIGGSTFFYDGSVPAPAGGSGGLWTFLDNKADRDLDIEIQGAIDEANDPPPLGLINICLHMGRLWGSVGNLQYFATGPDATVGNGNEAWSPANVFAMPDLIARSEPWDLPNGVLLVFTAGGPWAVWGTGIGNASPFYPKRFTQGSGLLSYDALDVAGPLIHMFTTDYRFLSFAPNAGYTQADPASEDTGEAIGDQFVKVTTGGISQALYTPEKTFVTYHTAGTNDTGVILADGAVGWFRISAVPPPESGTVWSPRAAIEGGTSAVQSIEVMPGVKKLLVGPPVPANVVLNITDIEIAFGTCTITHANLFLPFDNTPIILAGLTTVPALNGKTIYVSSAGTGSFEFATTLPDQAATAETGTGTVDGHWVSSGPILQRDTTVNSDNGALYDDAYATLGSIQLCQPTEQAEVAEITMDSMKVGTAPTVGVLMGEINPTAERQFTMLDATAKDPPLLPPSETLYNDAFSLMQNGQPTTCRHMQMKIQLAKEDQPSEILTTTIYGRRMAQRKAQAA
jgi:hypothetical protein